MDTRKTYNVCLMGCAFDTGNRGVSALGASLIKIIKTVREDAEFYLLIGSRNPGEYQISVGDNKKVTVREVNFRLSPKSKLKHHLFWIYFNALLYAFIPIPFIRKLIAKHVPWIKTVLEADFIGDIRGGDSFSDIYGMQRFIIGGLVTKTAFLLKKKLVFLPQTYGPYKAASAKRMARNLLKNSSAILSRDKEGIEELKKLLKKPDHINKITFCPDVAFMLDSLLPEKRMITPPLPEKKPLLFGINVSGLLYVGGYTGKNMFDLSIDYKGFIRDLIMNILDDKNVEILLVPHTYGRESSVENDYIACENILKEMNNPRVHMVSGDYDQNEIKGMIGLCDFFLGSRMHSCIAAISQGIPTIGLAYSKKFLGVFNSVGLKDMVIDAKSINADAALRRIYELFHARHGKQDDILANIKAVQNTILETFNTIM